MKQKKASFLILPITFIVTRFINLLQPPIFIDEALYLRWTQAFLNNRANWLISLQEAWAPLQIWLATGLSLINRTNLLFNLRFLSIIISGLSLIIIIKLTKLLFPQEKAAFWSGLLFILSPFVLIHDRLGIRDAGVTAIGLIILYGLSLRLFKKKKSGVFILSLGLALGLLWKNITWFFPGLTLLAYLWFKPKLKAYDLTILLALLLPLGFYLLTDTFSALAQKNQIFLISQLPNPELIRANLYQIFHWWFEYLTPPIVILTFLGAFTSWQRYRQSFYLLALFILPVLVFESLFAQILFPRYFLFTAVFSLIWASLGLKTLLNKNKVLTTIAILSLTPAIVFSSAIIKNLSTAPLPAIEKWQYVTGWPSGYGLRTLANHLKLNPPDVLIVEFSDLIRSGLPYYWPDHNLTVIVMSSDNQLSPDNIQLINQALSSKQSVVLALNILENPPKFFLADKIKSVPRPDNQTSLRLYQVDNLTYD